MALAWLSCGAIPPDGAPATRGKPAVVAVADGRGVQQVQPEISPPTTTAAVEQASAHVDSAPFDAVLKAHVRDGKVDYTALKADPRARAQLAEFVDGLARMPDAAPLSAWLNAYNALVIHFVVERYPIGSVMDVPNFFKALEEPVAGQRRSLDAIENLVIRKRFKDARVHVALNCGAVSCPDLHDRAFVEESLDADLDALARRAVADSRHVRWEDGKLALSEIFFWFEEDFVRDAGSVIAWVQRYADGRLRELSPGTPRIKLKYDWALADANRSPPRRDRESRRGQ